MSRSEAMPSQSSHLANEGRPDKLTLMVISCLAYIIAVALHEHAGHSLTCVLLGSHPTEMGAFYADCDNRGMSSLGVRLVALAGPVVSLLTGVVCFLILRRVPRSARLAYYFTWLLGSLGLMSAAGYPLFSGIAGIGDLGMTNGGLFYDIAPEWLWRIILTAVGVVSYRWVIQFMWQTLTLQLNNLESSSIQNARRTTMISYLTGAAVYAAIGLLNPHGFEIIAISVLPSSLGGTCGLIVMWKRKPDNPAFQGPGGGLNFPRDWAWIGVGIAATFAYAVIFGPTLRQ
jgi:hypothetical protein